MSADLMAARGSSLDVLEDEILTSILLAAARSESQQQQEQQKYLYGILSLVCRRFVQLLYGSCSSVLVPSTAASQPPSLFASWLSHQAAHVQELTIPAKLLVAVAEQQPLILPSLSNLCSLQLTGGYSEQVVFTLQSLSNLRELQLPATLEQDWTAATLCTVLTRLTSINLTRPVELTSLAPLSQLKQLQQIKLWGSLEVSELRHLTGLPITSLQVRSTSDDAAELAGWLSTGAATKLHNITSSLYEGAGGQALVQSLAQLPDLHTFNAVVPSTASDLDLQPLPSSTSLTALTLGGWRTKVNIAHLPSQLVDLAVVEGGLVNWGPSDQLASRLGRLTSLMLGCVAAADVHKLAVLTGLQSLSLGSYAEGEASYGRNPFSSASLQGLGTLSCLTQLKLVPTVTARTPDILPLLSSLSRLQSLHLGERYVSVREVSLSTAVNIIASSPALATLEVRVSKLGIVSGSGNYHVKSVSGPKVEILVLNGGDQLCTCWRNIVPGCTCFLTLYAVVISVCYKVVPCDLCACVSYGSAIRNYFQS